MRGIRRALALFCVAGWLLPVQAAAQDQPRVLFLTQSRGYEHDVVKRESGRLSLAERELTRLGEGHFAVDCSKDAAAAIREENLRRFRAVIFYTTGELPIADLDVLLGWVRAGGAFIGIHPATDTFKDHGPYVRLVGGTFDGHPWDWRSRVRIKVERLHPATRHLKETFFIRDEIYQHRNFQRDRVTVLLSLDLSDPATARLAEPGRSYPLAWVQEYGGGRVFYTALGHRADVWTDERFGEHLLKGILWAMKE